MRQCAAGCKVSSTRPRANLHVWKLVSILEAMSSLAEAALAESENFGLSAPARWPKRSGASTRRPLASRHHVAGRRGATFSLHAGAVTIGVQHHSSLPADHHFNAARLSGPRRIGVEGVIEVDDADCAYILAGAEAQRHRWGSSRSQTGRGAPGTSGWSIPTDATCG